MITKEKILKHSELFLEKAQKHALRSTSFHTCFAELEVFARLNYKYNINYSNDKAESLIKSLSKTLLDTVDIKKTANKIVFYDSFSLDNRGLTQQYLRAIFSWNSELLFITNSPIGKDILAELTNYPKAKIVQYNKNKFQEYSRVLAEIAAFQPEKVLLHFSPWDIAGFCIWNAVKNVDRFLINLTDHAFWLGKECADYILEFRAYGAYLSVTEREISFERLLLNPYYPIINKTPFQGFPFEKEDKLIAFAGSHFYKISGKNNKFLELINKVLQENKELFFVLAGPGNKEPILRFINDHNLNNRFFIIGDRKDISSVIENIDIYVNTFPMIGGLMSQYAAIYKKPIIGFTSPDLEAYNDVEDLLQIESQGILYKTNEDEFVAYFHQLITDEEVRKKNVELTNFCVLSPEEFTKRLYSNIYSYTDRIENSYIENIKFDSNAICDLYLEMENEYVHGHYELIVKTYKQKAFILFPVDTIRVLLKKINQKLNDK